MYKYYCKKCNNIIGTWNDEYEVYDGSNFCYRTKTKNNDLTYFLNCENCKKFVGIECWNVCKNCFGEKEIYEEEKLFNFFLKYRIQSKYICKICNKNKFRWQYWFFKELTFYK